jgi:hypothetical protein
MSANFLEEFKKVWNYLSGLEDNELLPEDIILVRVQEQQSMYRPE